MGRLTIPPVGTRRWPLALGLILTPPQTHEPATAPTPAAATAPSNTTVTASGDTTVTVAGDRAWDEPTSRHLMIALACYQTGYFLLHTLHLTPNRDRDRDPQENLKNTAEAENSGRPPLGLTATDWNRLRDLARHTNADALFTLGPTPSDLQDLDPLATELRLTLRPVEPAINPDRRDPDITLA